MRVLCIGLDKRVAFPEAAGYAVGWTREVAQLVSEYVVLAEARNGEARGPIQIAPNAVAYLVPGSAAKYPFAAARFAQRLHAEKPFDICTTEDPIRAGLAGALFSKRAGVPLNVEYHSFHINEPIWLRSKLHHRIYNKIAIWVAKRADSIRTYSPDQHAALLKVGVEECRIKAITSPAPQMNSIPRDEARALLKLSPDEKIVLAVGRMVPYKNVGALLDAMAIVKKRGNTRLLVAGDGPCLEDLKAKAESLSLGESIKWLGQVAEAEMTALYCGADVYVTTAVHEPGPRTIMEALAVGCPVICTRRQGVVHFGHCVDHETGLVVSHDDPPGIAAAIEAMLDDPVTARAWADVGRRRMEEQYPVSAIAGSVVGFFQQTLDRAQLDTAKTAVKAEC
jgi:glycosyltransferase involved in cell wall biosynthesis